MRRKLQGCQLIAATGLAMPMIWSKSFGPHRWGGTSDDAVCLHFTFDSNTSKFQRAVALISQCFSTVLGVHFSLKRGCLTLVLHGFLQFSSICITLNRNVIILSRSFQWFFHQTMVSLLSILSVICLSVYFVVDSPFRVIIMYIKNLSIHIAWNIL